MTALLIIGTGLVAIGAAIILLVFLTGAREREDAWQDAQSVAALAAERARQEMRERLLHARMRDGRR